MPPTASPNQAHTHPLARRALLRLAVAWLCGLIGGGLVSLRFGPAVAVLGGWNAAGLFLLVFAWINIYRCDAKSTQLRAALDDPGRNAMYLIVTLTSVVSLFSATILSRRTSAIAPTEEHVLLLLCLFTVALSWTLTHSSFTLRYAHLYYREDDEGIGGLKFPDDGPPTYFDFAYFAFTIGMCFQVSDVCITSPQIRRAVLLHAVISFAYNTAIIAFALSLAFAAV